MPLIVTTFEVYTVAGSALVIASNEKLLGTSSRVIVVTTKLYDPVAAMNIPVTVVSKLLADVNWRMIVSPPYATPGTPVNEPVLIW